MSKLAKIGIALGVTLVFLLVTLTILVKVVITPEKVRDHLLPMLEDSLQREIEVGGIDIGIFSGVSLSELRVLKKDTRDDFISVKTLSLNYKLRALLSGELVINRILLEKPVITIVRQPDGLFNFSDLLAKDSQTTAPATDGAKKPAPQKPKSASGLNLLISEVLIQEGELLFIDRSINPTTPFRYSLSQLNFLAKQITLDKSFPIELSAQLNGSAIAISGQYALAEQIGDLDIQLTALDLVQFAPYYRQSLPGKLGSASLTLNLEVQTQPQQIVSKGKVQLDKLDLLLTDLPEAALQQAKLGLDYALTFDQEQQKLAVSTLLVKFNDTAIAADGTVELGGAEPKLAMSLLIDRLDLRKLLQDLPAGITKQILPYSLAGLVDGRVDLAGAPSSGAKLVKSAHFDLVDVQATVDTLRTGINGSVSYADQALEAQKVQLKIADQQATLNFKASNLFGKIIKGEFDLSAATLDLNNILPQQPAQKSRPEQKASTKLPPAERTATMADEIGPFDLPLDMTGSLSVDKLLYKQLTLDKVRAKLLLKDNHLVVSQLQSGVAGGEFSATTDIDLGVKGLKYQGQMKLEQSQLVSLVSALVPQAQQSITGLLQWQNNFSGRGTLPDNLLKALQVKGALQLNKGKITGSPLLEQLASFLGSPDLKVLSFEAFEGRYDLRDGLANIGGQLDSSKAKLTPTGTVGVDGALNLKLDARIAPELMKQLGAKTGFGQALNDENGWGMLPLAIKGNLTSPQISFDATALQKQATGKLKQEASKKLLEQLGGDAAGNEPVRQLLDNTLNRLFGK